MRETRNLQSSENQWTHMEEDVNVSYEEHREVLCFSNNCFNFFISLGSEHM